MNLFESVLYFTDVYCKIKINKQLIIEEKTLCCRK